MGLTGYYILIGAIALISWLVSNQLKRKFAHYSKVQLRNGMSGAEVAQQMLSDHGIYDVEIISTPSLVNLDFADVKAIMSSGGVATVGMGTSDTGRRVEESVEEALANPLLDIDYNGATGALIHVTGGNDMTLEEIDQVGQIITTSLHADANVIWGARVDESHSKRITVMTIMTGVQSPHILGHETKEEKVESGKKVSDDLGITSVY